MQTNHTPGPWAISLSDDARVDDRITGVNGAPVIRGSIVNTLDAALIAAAPDMLAMLRDARVMVHAMTSDAPASAPWNALLPRIDAVIARATGEA